jgi:antitoxin component YwqK of YwqJK toxin-antitoxin module
MENGDISRKIGPAMTEWYENGKMKKQIWMIDGTPSRVNRPVLVEYDMHENPTHEQWYDRGVISTEKWSKNGKPHKDNCPAIINYDEKGDIVSTQSYINGKLVEPKMKGGSNNDYKEKYPKYKAKYLKLRK